MNTLTTNLFCRVRSPRLQAASTVLLLLLQRTPVLKFLVEAETGAASGVPQILRSAVVVAATLGAVDTVSGATTFVSNPSSPVNATASQPFRSGLFDHRFGQLRWRSSFLDDLWAVASRACHTRVGRRTGRHASVEFGNGIHHGYADSGGHLGCHLQGLGKGESVR